MFFKIVIAYEDYEAGTRARKMIERLASQLGSEFKTVSDDWKFEMIGDFRLMSHAVQAAAEADMVILAVSEAEELPPYVKQWFEQWAAFKRPDPTALVVLHNLTQVMMDECPSLRSYLQSIAVHSEIDLFWYGDDHSIPGQACPTSSGLLAMA